jgi:hypothetical protein
MNNFTARPTSRRTQAMFLIRLNCYVLIVAKASHASQE